MEAPDETAAGEEAFLSLQCNIGSETSHLLQALQDVRRPCRAPRLACS